MDKSPSQAEAWRDPPPFTVEAAGLALTFYPGGEDRLKALLAMIDEAQHRLQMAFYIFAPDESGRKVRDALVAAARRGVDVTVLLDGFGADADDGFFMGLVEAGGWFRRFSPHWNLRYLIRNHQKMVIADDRIAMIGGFNVADDYFAPPGENAWTDLALTVEGPVVARMSGWFTALARWTSSHLAQFAGIRRLVREWQVADGPVQLLIGGPTKGLSSWAREMGRDLIEGDRLDMVMAYFSPPRRLRRRIQQIARKGETRLVMAGTSDNAATIGASRSLYSRLLRAGAQVYEFQPCMLHTKLIVLDDAVYIGSANFDMRSLFLNLEIVLRIEDAALADRMREYVATHLPASVEITPELQRQRATWWNRARWQVSWFLVAVADYTVTRKLNLGL